MRCHFNPPARVERDDAATHAHAFVAISIHPPAWGGTRTVPLNKLKQVMQFQSTRPRGAGPGCSPDKQSPCDFNPPARVGRDGSSAPCSPPCRYFNPPARVGRDDEEMDKMRTALISIHPPAWGGTRKSCPCMNGYSRFQSTRPRGAGPAFTVPSTGISTFQSTRPRGAGPEQLRLLGNHLVISIHPPAWGGTPVSFHLRQTSQYFNPPARMGRDDSIGEGRTINPISIHPPAWGGTGAGLCEHAPGPISIHPPAWGGTYDYITDKCHTKFQSTRPRGAGPVLVHQTEEAGDISIHPPAWGGTISSRTSTPMMPNFNPPARVGRDIAGCGCAFGIGCISIHPPAWGGTSAPTRLFSLRLISIHPPAWGGTFFRLLRRGHHRISIHPPAWGGTPHPEHRLRNRQFQSTRPRGAGLTMTAQDRAELRISIHPPAWGGTNFRHNAGHEPHISIHPPAWDGTIVRSSEYR